MNSNVAILFAKLQYYSYRVWLRITHGKQKRDELFRKRKITISTFIREGYYEGNGIRTYCRENSDDFLHFFLRREEPVKLHLRLKRGQTFVDVGANVGYYSINASSKYGNDSSIRIVAIEAHPETFEVLTKNIQLNGCAEITAIQKAASDHAGKVVIYDDYDAETGKFITGGSSILDAVSHKGGKQRRSFEVNADTLDDILLNECRITNVDLMKMDIEGAEVLALKGASETLKKLKKIIIEIHGENLEAVKQILSENGFDLTFIPWRKQSYIVGTNQNL